MPADTETETADPADDLELDTTAYGIQERLDAEVDPPGARKELQWAMGEYERRVGAEGRELFSYYLEDKRKRKQEVDSLFDNPEVPGLMDDYTGPDAKEQRQRTANMAEFALRGGYETEDAVTMYPLFKDIYAQAAGKESMSDGELWEHISASKAVERAFHGSAIRSAVNHQPVSKSLGIWEQIARGSLGWNAERLQESLELHEQTRKYVGAKVEKLDPDARNITGIVQGANHDGDLAKALPYMRGKSDEDLAILWMILERDAKHREQEKGFSEQSSQAVERSFRDVLMKMGRTVDKINADLATGLYNQEGTRIPARLKTPEDILSWMMGQTAAQRGLAPAGIGTSGGMAVLAGPVAGFGEAEEYRVLTKADAAMVEATKKLLIEDKRTIAKLQNFSDLTLDPIKGSNWFTKYVYYPALSSSGVLATSMMGPTGFMINSMGLADDRYNELRDLGVAHEAAMRDSLIVGGLKAGVNQAQVGALMGKVPVFNRAMASLVGKPGGSAAWRFGAHYGGTMLAETGLELVEDHLVPAAVQHVTGEGGPVDWFSDRGPLMNAIRATPETAGPMVLLSFLGAGHATASDIHVSRQLMQSREALLQVGYDQAQVAQIREAAGRSAREGQEVMRALWDKRPNDQRSMQEAAKALQEQVHKQQAAVRELEQQGELPMMRSTAQGAWQVSFADGTTVELPTVEAANAARWQWLREKHPESYRRMEGMFGGGEDGKRAQTSAGEPVSGDPVSEDIELNFSMGTQPSMVRPIDIPTSNATLQGDEARNPKAIFRALTGEEAKEGYPGADGRATSGQRRKPGRRIASLADVVAWAHTNGRVLAPEKFRLEEAESGGNEHLVFPADESGRVVKITKPGLVGAQGEDAGAYILRWALANEAFGDDVKIEGIVQLPGEHAPRVVISQPFYEGRDATDSEIRDYFRQKGFHEHEGQWIHPIRRIKIWDNITEGNVIKTETGAMAVDLQVERASNADVRAVSEATGFGLESSFSLATTTGDFFPDAEVVQRGVSAEDAAELQRRLKATPIGRALLEGALFVPDRSSLDGREGRPGQSNYSEKNWRDMERAEGFHDPREGGLAAAVFLNNVEVRRGETPLEAVGRVLSHERMGHKEFNKLLKTVPELSQRWQQLVTHIPEEQLKGLRQRYKDVDGREEAPSLEWFADRAGALDSRKQLQPGSLLDQMWQTVSDVFRTILEPLSRDPSKKMSQEALDAHVRAFLRRMRKNMLEEAKGGSAGINGNAERGTLLSGANIGRDTVVESSPIGSIQGDTEPSELNFSMSGREVWTTPLGDRGKNEEIFEHVRKNKRALINDPNEQTRYSKQKAFVNELYDKNGGMKAYGSRFTDKSKPIVLLTMPSSSKANKLPVNLATRLRDDYKVELMNGDSIFQRATDTQAKDAETYLEKMALPQYTVKNAELAERLKGKRIILVDDLVTTGDSGEALRIIVKQLGEEVDSVIVLGTSKNAVPATAETIKTLRDELERQIHGAPTLPSAVNELLKQKDGLTVLIKDAHGHSLNSLLKKAVNDANSPLGAIAVIEAMIRRRDALKNATAQKK